MEIQGFSDYLIYEDGRVFSKKSRKMLKHRTYPNGYKYVGLWNEKKQCTRMIHRLIAIHYIDNPDNYPEVDHIDRNKTNNDISNLRWADRSMNTQNTRVCFNNKLGIKNISRHQKGYIYVKVIRGKVTRKTFKTLEEAIEYKNAFEL